MHLYVLNNFIRPFWLLISIVGMSQITSKSALQVVCSKVVALTTETSCSNSRQFQLIFVNGAILPPPPLIVHTVQILVPKHFNSYVMQCHVTV